ncbi:MAG: hypothetical protein ACFB2X_24815 [Rivularia sp. (in: cyanobacteria)]
MNVLGILFFSFGLLVILFGISIFTPLLSWVEKKINKSKFSSVNYNQPNSIRVTSIFIGICFFLFGLFITIASAALLDIWNIPENKNPSRPQSVLEKPEIAMVAPQNSTTSLNHNNNLSVTKYRLDCLSQADALNMRKEVGLNTEIITLIPCNAIGIQDTNKRDYKDGIEWFLVKYQQKTGWVVGKYLKQQNTNFNRNKILSKLLAKKRP